MNHLHMDIHLIVAVTIGGIAILNAALFWFMPCLTRRDLYFAVTVLPGFRDQFQGTSILRRYRIELILLSVLALAVFVAGFVWLGVGFVPAGRFIPVAASFIAFYRARCAYSRLRSSRPRSARQNSSAIIASFPVAGWPPWGHSFC